MALPSQPALLATCQCCRRETRTWSEQETIQIPATHRLAGAFPACHCGSAGAPHEHPRCPGGRAPGTAALRAGQGQEELVRNVCTLAALHASSPKARWPEDTLPGGSSSMAGASVPTPMLNPSALGHRLSPGTATAPGKIFPVGLQLLCASTATNQAAIEGRNTPSASPCEKERKGMICRQEGPNLIPFSKSLALFGHNFATIFILNESPLIFFFLSTLLSL